MTATPNELDEKTNVDVVRETYEAVGRGDIPALLDLLTDDVEWTLQGPTVIPFAGTRRGREGSAEFFSLVGGNLEFQQFEPRKFGLRDCPAHVFIRRVPIFGNACRRTDSAAARPSYRKGG